MRKENQTENRKKGILAYCLVCFGVSIMILLASAIFVVAFWYMRTFDLEFKELLYTMMSPLQGTGESTVNDVISNCLPPVLITLSVLLMLSVVFYFTRSLWRLLCKVSVSAGALLLVGSLGFSLYAFRIPAYLKMRMEQTTIYEEYYVDPDSVLISADGKPKNLIYIYAESLETTYASTELGGLQPENYMWRLTNLAQRYVSFSNRSKGELGGIYTPAGTGWTMASLLSTTSGIPFSFPLGENRENEMGERERFAGGLTTLGDILAQKGYRQEFLCGSDSAFAGRDLYFTQHGNYEIFDLFTAREKGYIPMDYSVFWGFEDRVLFEIAKDEIVRLYETGDPFNFTMLTLDLHHVGGYFCSECQELYENETANIVDCTDRQITAFVEWCQQQSFYEDTAIVIVGDHPRMDRILVDSEEPYDRVVYNCFINSAVEPEGIVYNRASTLFDIFPTTLAAMGFQIEGDRLGLGVNLFSQEATLAEQLGYQVLNEEVQKYSEYYIRHFS